MSVNNVIDPSDLFRELNLVGEPAASDVDNIADQLASTTENIRTLINRNHAQKAAAAHQLDLSTSGGGGELEDIAKQIADHAETLYQTWKARGLTPTEVLRSHNTTALNSEAAQTLSRQLRDSSSRPSTPSRHSPTPAPAAPRQAALTSNTPPGSSPQPLEHTIPIRLERGAAAGSATTPAAVQQQQRQQVQQQQKPGQQVHHFQVQQQQPAQQQQKPKQQVHHIQVQAPQQKVQQQQKQAQQQVNVNGSASASSPVHERAGPPPDRWKPAAAQERPSERWPSAGRASGASPPERREAPAGRWLPVTSARDPAPERREAASRAGGAAISPVDLLASPDGDKSLEELVKNFVQEDKARRGGPGSPNSPPAGYQTLPNPGSQRAYRGAKTAPSLLSPGAGHARVQVNTNGQTRVVDVNNEVDGVGGGGGTWPRASHQQRAQPNQSAASPTQAQKPQEVVLKSHPTASSPAQNMVRAAPQIHTPPPEVVTASDAAQAALDEVRQQEKALLSALQSGAVIRERRDLSPRPGSADSGSSMSTVDYAKQRFQDPQSRSRAAQRLEDSRQLAGRGGVTGAQVTEARSRFDNGQINISDSQWRSEWLPTRYSVDPDSGVLMPADQPWRRKRVPLKTAGEPGGRIVSPLPHPQLTEEQKQHIRDRTLSPTPYNAAGVAIRPFLTQGSVAERVSIFEKSPSELRQRAEVAEKKQPAIATWRPQNEVKDKAQTYGRERDTRSSTESPTASPKSPPRRPANASAQRPQKHCAIPKFHFPHGRPDSREKMEAQIQRISQAFSSYPGGQVPKDKFAAIAKACELPLYWKVPLFLAAGGEKTGHVTAAAFLDFWKRLVATCHDPSSRFVRILTGGLRQHLVPEDFVPLVQDVVETHPGLNFLKEAVEFHSRYVHTVIARIFYCVNRSWSGRITIPELRRSSLLRTIQLLEQEEDINQITEYFSYEHFYVIYCKFWELDKDHDLLIDKADVARHNDHAVSSRIIDRIFSGAVTRGSVRKQEKMTYMEFVWFLLSEEDKKHPTAIEYWFRCMDLDGDGFLSMYELEYFYEEQLQRMEALGIEALPFEDCLCWMLDMVQPAVPGKIALSDLKQCQMTNIFFDTFFNLEKYLEHDQRDPFAMQRDGEPGQPMSDWDRFAAEEYELLVAEEGAAEQDPEFLYEDGDPEASEPLERLSINEPVRNSAPTLQSRPRVDADEDYAETDADYTYITDAPGSYVKPKVV